MHTSQDSICLTDLTPSGCMTGFRGPLAWQPSASGARYAQHNSFIVESCTTWLRLPECDVLCPRGHGARGVRTRWAGRRSTYLVGFSFTTQTRRWIQTPQSRHLCRACRQEAMIPNLWHSESNSGQLPQKGYPRSQPKGVKMPSFHPKTATWRSDTPCSLQATALVRKSNCNVRTLYAMS
jgi:hypothetical protein